MQLSIIIPTLNEESTIGCLLEDLLQSPVETEIIVADAGSEDNTTEIVLDAGCHLIDCSEANRGKQLNAGAKAASGEILLFLHADSRLEPEALQSLVDRLQASNIIAGGNFKLRFDGRDLFSRFMSHFYNWLRQFKIYYGDSGIFVRREVFDELGGFSPLGIMEDYDFVRKLEGSKQSIRIDTTELSTSSRRFSGKNPISVFARWIWMHWLYWRGTSSEQLKKEYQRA